VRIAQHIKIGEPDDPIAATTEVGRTHSLLLIGPCGIVAVAVDLENQPFALEGKVDNVVTDGACRLMCLPLVRNGYNSSQNLRSAGV